MLASAVRSVRWPATSPFDDVLELTHVSRVRILLQRDQSLFWAAHPQLIGAFADRQNRLLGENPSALRGFPVLEGAAGSCRINLKEQREGRDIGSRARNLY